jgi:phosphate transport system ATP-binding protein
MATTSYAAILTERNLNGRELTPQNNSSPKYQIKNLNFWYGAHQALFNIDFLIPERSVTALIGPSGCGKSTFLREFAKLAEKITNDVLYLNASSDLDVINNVTQHQSDGQRQINNLNMALQLILFLQVILGQIWLWPCPKKFASKLYLRYRWGD